MSRPRTVNQDFTLAFWLKFPTAPTGDYWHYLDLYPCATNNTRLEFYNVQGNMYGRFMVPDGAGGSHTVYKLLGAHGVDAWHHYAVARKGPR